MSMFCFQCEQTAQGKGCTIQGVCGKKEDIANLQDDLTSKIIDLAHTAQPNEETTKAIIDGLFVSITNVNFDNEKIEKYTHKITHLMKHPEQSYYIKSLWDEQNEDIKSLKTTVKQA